MLRIAALVCLAFAPFVMASLAIAQEKQSTPTNADQAKLFQDLEENLNNVALVGSFTVVGKEDKGLKPERYEIKNVRKLEEGDLWQINARIKYGDKDITIPMPLEIKWAGKTPVITLDKTTIPGMGTFSAHVVIDGDKYAGTWTHGEVGGHLFGRIEKITEEAKTE